MAKRGFRRGVSGEKSKDVVLSMVLGIPAWLLFFVNMIFSIVRKGEASLVFGYLFIVECALSVWAVIFAFLSWRDEDGSVGSKRFAVMFNLILLLLETGLVVLYFIH